ncbi:nitroreductase family protein [Dactylosporangium aurantiacum]|uniref:Nitroreductase family protein n=1 Tax=Dactylosporangium aurantiacum TaxID=35754 RepID=A0A9Q9IMJ9_9ACTN|nr:nitroreductase family protein [Dactylosporangium aurantiacum]MDG6103884.1 nitroreductase family protein [Dactylosporangium aurantiacum]UWZ58922.1 nitroreductase family protein [Dactylosporangium aurantiacum]
MTTITILQEHVDKAAATSVPLHPLLARRWSPRAFDQAHELTPQQVTALLEAARWAPSASNTQPWRFAVTHRGSAEHAAVLDTLTAGNRAWAHAASALIVVAAETVTGDGTARPWAVYDAGQAVAHLSVQAEHEGLVVHQMGGFDRDRVAALLGAARVTPLVVVAVGRRDGAFRLDPPLAGRELAARDRLPVEHLLLPVRPAA